MTIRRIELQPAYVLHTYSYLNSSTIIRVLTRDFGLISVLVRGAKRANSPFRGMLQPFLPIYISCYTKTALYQIIQVDPIKIQGIYPRDKLVFGLYLNELVLKLIHEADPCPLIFDRYKETLDKLYKGTEKVEILLRKFEMTLLKEIGFGLDFTRESGTGKLIEGNKFYRFDPENGFVEIAGYISGQILFSGENLLSIGSNNFFNEQILLDAKRVMRKAISHKLGGKLLNSRKLLIRSIEVS